MKGIRGVMRVVVVLAVVVLLGAVAVAPAGATAAAPVRPFQATFQLQVVGITPINDFSWYEKQTGLGNATHLGLSTITHDPLLVDISAIGTTGCLTLSGPGTMVAFNGDQLNFTMAGSPCPTADGHIPGTFEYTVTGGTGRFAGATGSGTMDGDFFNGVITEIYTGTLAY